MGRVARTAAGVLALVLAACGGGGGGGEAPSPAPSAPTAPTTLQPTNYVVQGLVNGLAEGSTLTLLVNGQPAMSIARNGEFRLAQLFHTGDTYQLSVAAPAGAIAQTCGVQGGVGTINGDVSNVLVTCSTLLFKLGGQVNGLRSGGLVLRSLRGDELAVAADGRFEFAGAVPSGGSYGVLIAQQPGGVPAQICTVSQGSGIVAAADISDVAVDCSTNTYRVGGSVEGLLGLGLQLQLNGDALIAREANGSFVFEQPLASASAYQVSVKTQPVNPAQTCSVIDGSGAGVVGRGDEFGVRVVCSNNSYTVGGMVQGLVGAGLVLRNNGADDLPVASNGFFAFPQKVASGGAYAITVRSHPDHPRQTCSVNAGTGQIVDGEAVGARVVCSTLDYPLTVEVHGLRIDRTGGLILRNNGADDLPIYGNGPATFTTRLVSGAAYAVTVARQPVPITAARDIDTCTVRPGTASGTIDPDIPAIVDVDCAAVTDAVLVRVSGLEGAGLRVMDAVQGTGRAIAADGDFVINGYPTGSSYRFFVDGQPATQSCFVSSGEGTVGSAPPLPFVNVRCGPRLGMAMLMVNSGSDTLELHTRRDNGTWQYLTFAPTGGRQPEDMVLSPSRRYVYVCNVQSKSIATFELDPLGGTLRQIGLTATEAEPWRLHMHPSGRFLYAELNSGIPKVQIFSIDPVNGMPTSNGPANSLGHNIVLDAAGRFGQMHAIAGWFFSFEIDSTTGAIVPIAGEPHYFSDRYFSSNLVMAPSGNYLLATSEDVQAGRQGIALQRRDPVSGLMLGLPERPQILSFDNDGRSVVSLALSPTGRYMAFVRDNLLASPSALGNPTIHFAAIDPVTGRVTYSTAAGQQVAQQRLPGASVEGWYLTFDPSEKFVYASRTLGGQVDVYAVDPEAGSIRLDSSIQARRENGNFTWAKRTLVFELRPETPAQAKARLRKPVSAARPVKAPARAP